MQLQPPNPASNHVPPARRPLQATPAQKYTVQEDVYRGSAAAIGSALAKIGKNSRALGHAADASGVLGINLVAFNAALGAAGLGLGAIDILQGRDHFEKGDKVLGCLNLVGGVSNSLGGLISLAEAFGPQPGLEGYGSVAMSFGMAADASEDFLEASRLRRPDFLPRAYVKMAGAGILLSGALIGDPSVQMIGNLVCVGGIVLHHAPHWLGLEKQDRPAA